LTSLLASMTDRHVTRPQTAVDTPPKHTLPKEERSLMSGAIAKYHRGV